MRKTVVAGVGLGCFLSTLLLYSETITPFQRFAGIGSFVGAFAPLSLALAAVISAVLLVIGWRGRFVPGRVMRVVGGVLYVVANVAFACAAVFSVPEGPVRSWAIGALAAVVALGSVGVALLWGRVYARLPMRRSLVAVALAGLVACVIGPVLMVVPAPACVALFGAASLAAAVLPGVLLGACGDGEGARERRDAVDAGAGEVGDEDGVGTPARGDAPVGRPGASAWGGDPSRRGLSERLRSFLDVAAPAFVGLLAFAFVMGMMRDLIVEACPVHIATMALVSVGLLGLGLGARRRRLVVRHAESRLIPVLAVTLLAVTNVTAVLWGGAVIDRVMIYLLYTLAAALTLASLSAMAHAGEFASDVIFSMALALFSLASFVGIRASEMVTPREASAAITIVTTVYAFAMVLLPVCAWGGESRAETKASAPRWHGAPAGKARGGRCQAMPATTAARGGRMTPPLGWLAGRGKAGPARGGALTPDQGSGPVRDRAGRCAELVASGGLTAREAEVLAILAEGHASGYISEVLYISPNTARTHIHNIYRKLGVGSREELLVLVRG